MKKTIKTVALFPVLGLMSVGCQKENLELPTQQTTVTIVSYSAGDYCGQAALANDAAWDEFMNRMLALARQGYSVIIYNGSNVTSNSPKTKVVFTTDSESEAKQWAKEMAQQGYAVEIIYDEQTGIWTCIATI